MSKHNVALIFGGCTPEHEVSIVTAHQVYLALQENHHVIPVYITKDGEWLTGDALRDLSVFTDGTLPHPPDFDKITIEFHPEPQFVITGKHWLGKNVRRRTPLPVDVVFPAIHGMHGEDGTLQGLLELMNLPYVGAGVVGSAVGMDKIMMKAILGENALPVLPYLYWTPPRLGDTTRRSSQRGGCNPGLSTLCQTCDERFKHRGQLCQKSI